MCGGIQALYRKIRLRDEILYYYKVENTGLSGLTKATPTVQEFCPKFHTACRLG